jgi:hypothetical protein
MWMQFWLYRCSCADTVLLATVADACVASPIWIRMCITSFMAAAQPGCCPICFECDTDFGKVSGTTEPCTYMALSNEE